VAVKAGAESGGISLPDFPWDRLISWRTLANEHPNGLCDLSVGTPVDPVPTQIQQVLSGAADAPGYPTTHGTLELRISIVDWLARRLGIPGVDPQAVLPAIGTKELIAGLANQLGIEPGETVVIPETAYPTYEVGALLARAIPVRADSLTQLGPTTPAMIWLNSPSNPTGKVLGIEHLRKVVEWARDRGVIVASDECYIELGWTEERPVSILHPDVCGGDHTGLLAVHSLSKRSNLAGYRFGFMTGDAAIVQRVLEVRKHSGFMVPTPVQIAATAAFGDDEHVVVQRAIYRARREMLLPALTTAGFAVDDSDAGLYLWATRGERCMDTVEWLAKRGILVAPGDFYGAAGSQHVRVALTATDERVRSAALRLLAE
jgi:succinyldiaminopimelate transaminase